MAGVGIPPEWSAIGDDDVPSDITVEAIVRPPKTAEDGAADPPLDDAWRHFQPLVRPYETDRASYRSAPYTKPVFVFFHAALWRRLVRSGSLRRALDAVLLLGFVPADDDGVGRWDAMDKVAIRFRFLDQGGSTKTVTFDESAAEPTTERVRELETEVRELTRQLRHLRSGDGIVPTIVNSKPIVGSCHSCCVVCLHLNHLDPDATPFVVSLGLTSGRLLIPCTILEHRFLLFVAPHQPRGSIPVSVLATTPGGNLRRYTRSVWMEYKNTDALPALSHHAINQLVGDIPLPSSISAPDTSENPENKSEATSVVEDPTFEDETSDNASERPAAEPHIPLTREMLDLLQLGRGIPVAPIVRRMRSGVGSDGSETAASSMLRADARGHTPVIDASTSMQRDSSGVSDDASAAARRGRRGEDAPHSPRTQDDGGVASST